jgi:hypothetical protein
MSALDQLGLDIEVPTVIDENRRYTTPALMAYVKAIANVHAWDLDPDADAESHHAPRWFSLTREPGSAGVDSLSQSWMPPCLHRGDVCQRGDRIVCAENECDVFDGFRPWCIFNNPPFTDIGSRVEKVWRTIEEARGLQFEVRVAMIMPGNRGEQPWWQEHVEPFLAGHAHENRCGYQLTAHHPPGRQAYGYPGNPAGIGSKAATPWPTLMLLWRRA